MFKRLWEWIKRPHGWPLIPLYALTALCIAGAVVFGIVDIGKAAFVAYIFYGLSTVLFCYAVYSIVKIAPTLKESVKDKLKANKITAGMLESYDFKTTVFALLSFVITIAFAIMNLVSAIRYRLVWYGAIAAYYFVLILFRGGVLLADRKCARAFADDPDGYEKVRWKIYLASGAFLILLEGAMIGAVTQMMLSERPTHSGEIMAIANAAYTFYKVIMAIYNLVRARHTKSPVTQSLRNLNFADACMSIVSLTVLMLSTFGGDDIGPVQYIKYAVGFAACAGIIALASVMIIRACKKLNELKENSANEQ